MKSHDTQKTNLQPTNSATNAFTVPVELQIPTRDEEQIDDFITTKENQATQGCKGYRQLIFLLCLTYP